MGRNIAIALTIVSILFFGYIALGRHDVTLEMNPTISWGFAHMMAAFMIGCLIGVFTPATGTQKEAVKTELIKLATRLALVALGLALVDIKLGRLLAIPIALPLVGIMLFAETIGSLLAFEPPKK